MQTVRCLSFRHNVFYMSIIIDRKPHIAPQFQREHHQSSIACHPIASLHSVLPCIWFLSETKSSFFSLCLQYVPLSAVCHSDAACIASNCKRFLLCSGIQTTPCPIMRRVTESSTLIKANSCKGALMSNWIFLRIINY